MTFGNQVLPVRITIRSQLDNHVDAEFTQTNLFGIQFTVRQTSYLFSVLEYTWPFMEADECNLIPIIILWHLVCIRICLTNMD
jgi:hypothetical protein